MIKLIVLQRKSSAFHTFSDDFSGVFLFFSPALLCVFRTQNQHHITTSLSAAAERNNFSTLERSLVPAVSNEVQAVYTHPPRTQKTPTFPRLTEGLRSINIIVHYFTLECYLSLFIVTSSIVMKSGNLQWYICIKKKNTKLVLIFL